MVELKDKPDCPEVRHRRAGDESYDWCDVADKYCLIQHGTLECEIYNDYLKELEDDRG